MFDKIIKIIKAWFHTEEDEQPERFSEKEVIYHLKQGEAKLAKTGDDYRIYEPFWIPILKEYERQKSYKLRFEFIPPLQNFRNVRSALQFKYQSFSAWKEIRDYVEKRHGGKCEVCGLTSQDHDPKKPTATECHEVWHYNEQTKIQKLVKLRSLCCRCHAITHLSMHFKDRELTLALLHDYADLNGIQLDQAYADLEFAYKERDRRKSVSYLLDLSLIEKLGLSYEIDKLFNPHEQAFISFLELKFKQNKDLDNE